MPVALGTVLVYVGSSQEGGADLHEINGSGVTGEIEFEDDGTTLVVEGEAEGLVRQAPAGC